MKMTDEHWDNMMAALNLKAQEVGVSDPNQILRMLKADWDSYTDPDWCEKLVEEKELEALEKQEAEHAKAAARLAELRAKKTP